jgi:hypothetical protein
MLWVIDEITSGFDSLGTIVQSAVNSEPINVVSGITATLGAFSSSINATYGVFASNNGTDTFTVGGGFSQITQIKETTENALTILTEYVSTNDTTVNVDFSPSQNEVGIIGIEIKVVPTVTTNYLASRARKRIDLSGVSAG